MKTQLTIQYPIFGYGELVNKPETQAKYLFKLNNQNELSQINIKNPILKTNDILKFCAQLPRECKIESTRTSENVSQRAVYFQQERIFSIKIYKLTKTGTIRAFGNPASFQQWKNYSFNGTQYNLFYFKDNLSNDEFLEKINNLKKHFNRNHPMILFAKYIASFDTADVFLQATIRRQYPPSIFIDGTFDRNYFEEYEGYWQINLIDDDNYPMKFRNDNKISRIHSIFYLTPYYAQFLEESNVIELDTSFYVLRPYVYSVPNLIYKNESLPIGLVVGPTEKYDIYANFYTFIEKISKKAYDIIITKPILSDQGSALLSFSSKFNLRHFYCYRHIIQNYGSSELSKIVKILLFSHTFEEFKHNLQILETEILTLFSNVKQSKIDSFISLFSITINEEKNQLIPPNSPDDIPQALWERAKLGIPTCSNHCESLHGKVNKKSKTLKKFTKRLTVLLDHIEDRKDIFITRRNLHEKIAKIKRCKAEQRDNCLCTVDLFANSLYGEQIPCMHQIQKFNFTKFPEIPSLSTFSIQIETITNPNWEFPKRHSYPVIELTGYECLLVSIYGKPQYKELRAIEAVYDQKSDFGKFKTFIRSAFITYASTYYGYYDYSIESISNFLKFAKNLLFKEKNEITVSYSQKAKEDNLILLEKMIDEIDITQSSDINIIKKPSPKKAKESQSGTVVIKTEYDLLKEQVIKTINENQSMPPKDFFKLYFEQYEVLKQKLETLENK